MEGGMVTEASSRAKLPTPVRKWRKRGMGLLELALRVAALAGAVAALIRMATTDEQLPVFTQFFQFEAQFSDFPAFNYFIIANSVAAAYLLLVAMPLSVLHIIRPHMLLTRALVLLPLDCVVLAVLTAGASAAASSDYLANKGNSRANWFSICQQFGDFCRSATTAIALSFSSVLFFVLFISLSSFNLFRIAKATR